MTKFYTYAKHYGNSILLRTCEDGKRKTEWVDFSPTLYIPAKAGDSTPYRGIGGEKITPIQFGDNKTAKEFVEQYDGVENFPIFGQTHWGYQYLSDTFKGEVPWDITQIKIYSTDIETSVENGFPDVFNPIEQVLLITLQDYSSKKIRTFGLGPYEATEHTSHMDVEYTECSDEKDLFRQFVRYWANDYPDILTGWNSKFFDVSYIISRIERIFEEEEAKALKKLMSPFGLVRAYEKEMGGRMYKSYDMQGVSQLDYLDVYKKFTYVTRESYKLDHIAEVELGHKKLDNPYPTFREFYTKDWNLFVEYNIVDTALVDGLEEKLKLIELCITMTYDAKMNFEDVFSPVKTWDCLVYNDLREIDVVIGQPKDRPERRIQGAYVQEPVPGAYEWVESFDATSLYPSILMQYNMSPETLVEGDSFDVSVDGLLESQYQFNTQHAIAGNGHLFKRDKQGHFPKIVQKFFDDRQRYKKLMLKAKQELEDLENNNGTVEQMRLKRNDIAKYDNFQMARKIQLNSLYGAMANKYFRYYDSRIAEAITLSGQYIIRKAAQGLDMFLNDVLKTNGEVYSFYTDTDSCYVTLNALVDKFYGDKPKDKVVDILDKIGSDQIEPCIARAMTQLANYTNAFEEKIFFKREAIADRALWVSKKRYAMNVYDNEGVRYKEPVLKIMGLEIVRSSTPAPVRASLKEAVKLCLTGTEEELHKFVAETKRKFYQMNPEDIAFPRGCNNLAKYSSHTTIYGTRTPIHVRASLLYNFYLKKKSLTQTYELIQEGDKVKFLYLKVPNTIHEDVIGFTGKMPEEFDLHKYIDFEKNFEKAFLEPLVNILNSLGWHTEPQATLEGLFV